MTSPLHKSGKTDTTAIIAITATPTTSTTPTVPAGCKEDEGHESYESYGCHENDEWLASPRTLSVAARILQRGGEDCLGRHGVGTVQAVMVLGVFRPSWCRDCLGHHGARTV